MSAEDRDGLRRAMGEAAALPPEDPQRQALEAQVAREGNWAEQEWLAILEMDERLRLELRRLPVPAGLEERLLAIPNELPARRTTGWRRWLTAAAVLLVALGVTVTVHLTGQAVYTQALRSVALMAIDDHFNDRRIRIETADPADLKARLAGQVPFGVSLPRLGADFRLVGGRTCKWAGCPVVYTLWQRSGKTYSMIQFWAEDFELPVTMRKEVVCCEQPGSEQDPTDVLLWTDRGSGYALVAHHGAFAEGWAGQTSVEAGSG